MGSRALIGLLIAGLTTVGCPDSPPVGPSPTPVPTSSTKPTGGAEAKSPEGPETSESPSAKATPSPTPSPPEKSRPPLRLGDLSGGLKVDEVDPTIGRTTVKTPAADPKRERPRASKEPKRNLSLKALADREAVRAYKEISDTARSGKTFRGGAALMRDAEERILKENPNRFRRGEVRKALDLAMQRYLKDGRFKADMRRLQQGR